jgi:hypothetical protein
MNRLRYGCGLCMTVALALTSYAADGDVGCLVPASGDPFRVAGQNGWIMECHKTQDQANPAVSFSPESDRWSPRAPSIFVGFCPRSRDVCRTVPELMKAEKQFPGWPGVTDMGTLPIHDGALARVTTWSDRSEWWTAEAFVESKTDIITVALLCHSQVAFDNSYPTFVSVVGSLTLHPKRGR